MTRKNTWFLPLVEEVERQAQIMLSDEAWGDVSGNDAYQMAIDNVSDDRAIHVAEAGGKLPSCFGRDDVYVPLLKAFENHLDREIRQ